MSDFDAALARCGMLDEDALGRPWTWREPVARFELSTWAVKKTIARGTAYLLGRGAEPRMGSSRCGGSGAAPG